MSNIPAESTVRTLAVQGQPFTVIKIDYPDGALFAVRCPDGLALDTADETEDEPTDADIHEIAGVYFSEVVPQQRENAILRQNHQPDDQPPPYDIYGAT